MNEIEKQLYPDINDKLLNIKNIILEKVVTKLQFPNNDSKNFDQRVIAGQLEEQFVNITIKEIKNSFPPKSVKSTEDVSLEYDWGKILIDVKTSDTNREFSMPNLISIWDLKKEFYKMHLLYCFINYCNKQKKILNVNLFYIWQLPWRFLLISNLGKGQLQIKSMKDCHSNMNNLNFTTFSKDDWYNDLLLNGEEFYKDLLVKTNKRLIDWRK